VDLEVADTEVAVDLAVDTKVAANTVINSLFLLILRNNLKKFVFLLYFSKYLIYRSIILYLELIFCKRFQDSEVMVVVSLKGKNLLHMQEFYIECRCVHVIITKIIILEINI